MDESQAKVLAEALGGETWQSGGEIWLVLFRREDGAVVCMSDESIAEYTSEDDLCSGEPRISIILR